MRSRYPVPEFVRFFPRYLREAGYYTTNNSKKDYNTIDQPDAWDESSKTATYMNRPEGKPFFAVFNTSISHESSIHKPLDSLRRSEEHTSELQSLMRTSYAVFCLKKKTTTNT